jgi:hypothetical protein
MKRAFRSNPTAGGSRSRAGKRSSNICDAGNDTGSAKNGTGARSGKIRHKKLFTAESAENAEVNQNQETRSKRQNDQENQKFLHFAFWFVFLILPIFILLCELCGLMML